MTMTALNVRFLEPNSQEFRELLYERLKQLILGLREGLYTWQDYFYIITSLVALGDLSREHAVQLLKSPTLSTLDSIFGKRTVRKINTKFFGEIVLPDETPCLVVVPTREVATGLIRQYSFLSPLEKFSADVEYAVCSVYKAISTIVNYGNLIKNIVIIPEGDARVIFDFTSGRFVSKPGRAYVALILLARLYNINVSGVALQFDFEKEQVRKTIESSGRVKALLEVLDELEETTTGKVVTIKTPVDLTEFMRAIAMGFVNRYGVKELKRGGVELDVTVMLQYDEQFYELLHKVATDVPRRIPLVGWWLFGGEEAPIDQARYELARQLGFDEKTARKIAKWRVTSVNDVVKLLKDLRYNYRDDNYFRNVVVPKIAQIFNTRPEVLIQLLELDLL